MFLSKKNPKKGSKKLPNSVEISIWQNLYWHFFGIYASTNLIKNYYLKNPQISTYVDKKIAFLRWLSRLNELDLCGLFFIE